MAKLATAATNKVRSWRKRRPWSWAELIARTPPHGTEAAAVSQ
ncbi:MAG TPA: hypothetical protein VE891_13885 [Allosphingosinicella sp.]|nr:hypothetical protein [Allosphingosinicella sp.]